MTTMSDGAAAPAAVENAPKVGRPKKMLGWSLSLIGAFALMGVAVSLNPESPFTQPLDDWWRALVGNSPDDATYQQPLAMFFQHLGEALGAIVMVLLLPIGLAVVGRWRSALFVISGVMFSAGLLSQAMKNLVDRPRPAADEALGLYGPLFHTDHGSFPSGHAVTAGAIAIVVLALIPASRERLRKIWMVLGAFIMIGMIWQRTLINAHWLSDAIFGVIAGVGGALLMWWAFYPLLKADHARDVWFLRGRKATAEVPAA